MEEPNMLEVEQRENDWEWTRFNWREAELEEVVRLSERIVILKDHEKVGEVVNGPEVTAESIVSVIATESGDEAEKTADALADEVAAGGSTADNEGSAS